MIVWRIIIGFLLGCGCNHIVALYFLMYELSNPANRQYARVIRYDILTLLLSLLAALIVSRRWLSRAVGEMVVVAIGVCCGAVAYTIWLLHLIT